MEDTTAAATPAGGAAQPTGTPEGGAAQPTAATGDGGHGGTPPQVGATEEGSAFAAIAEGTGAEARHPEGTDGGQAPRTPGQGGETEEIDFEKTSDEEYAKLVVPDREGEEVDRSLITDMAKELRAAKVPPSQMARIGKIYDAAVRAAIAKSDAAHAARMKEGREKCLAQLTEEEVRDAAAAYREYVAPDARLAARVKNSEIWNEPALVRLMAIAGSTLRVETPPPVSAAAGSSQSDLDRRIFEKTVPKDLR